MAVPIGLSGNMHCGVADRYTLFYWLNSDKALASSSQCSVASPSMSKSIPSRTASPNGRKLDWPPRKLFHR